MTPASRARIVSPNRTHYVYRGEAPRQNVGLYIYIYGKSIKIAILGYETPRGCEMDPCRMYLPLRSVIMFNSTTKRRLLISTVVGVWVGVSLLLHIPFSSPTQVRMLNDVGTVAPVQSHMSLRVKVNRRGSVPTILIIISTTSPNYATRVQSIRNTWMKRVVDKPSMDLLFVGDSGPVVFPDLAQSMCKVGYNEAACKNGDMISYAYDFLRRAQGEFIDWVFFADDDVYIFPDNLQRMIMSLGPTAVRSRAVWAQNGCVVDRCVGICGGAGFFTNRESLFWIQEGLDTSRYERLGDEAASFAKQCGSFGDLAISRVIKDRRGIPIYDVPKGAFAYNFPNPEADLLASLQACTERPWLYHYPSRDRMLYIQEKGAEFHTDVPLSEDGDPAAGVHDPLCVNNFASTNSTTTTTTTTTTATVVS